MSSKSSTKLRLNSNINHDLTAILDWRQLQIVKPVTNLLHRFNQDNEVDEVLSPNCLESGSEPTPNLEPTPIKPTGRIGSKSTLTNEYEDLTIELANLQAESYSRDLELQNMKGFIKELESDLKQQSKQLKHDQTLIQDLIQESQESKQSLNQLEWENKLLKNKNLDLETKCSELENRMHLSETSVFHSRVIRLKSVSLDTI